MMFRQGDVLVVRADAAHAGAEIPRDAGRVVLAYGELTGHTHAITTKAVHLHRPEREATQQELIVLAERVLRIGRGGAALEHEEHATIRLPAGTYIVRQQREYSPQALRSVAD